VGFGELSARLDEVGLGPEDAGIAAEREVNRSGKRYLGMR
jgi:hypothetical protein